MTRIAPVNLAYNPKTLWFDARDLEISSHDFVVVLTARGVELGHMAGPVFEATPEDLSRLKSELKSVKRIATEEDIAQGERMEELGKEALPIFREMVEEAGENMRPISVEYLLEGDKAVFYFEAEDRVDFRDLVRALAGRFHVRVDMRQIGVRDEARMVGGYGHCGQQLCCCRMGGEFCPVSIRMAKEQDLSLNPQKISGVCGRLMCCLRYEFDAYKDFKSRAPKQNAVIETPDGPAKVSALDVPREVVSLRLEEDHKVVKVPLSDMETPEGAQRPTSVGKEAWESALAPEPTEAMAANYLTSQLTGSDQLGTARAVRRNNANVKNATGSTPLPTTQKADANSRRRRRRKEEAEVEPVVVETVHRQRRRRSTKLGSDGTQVQVEVEAAQGAASAEPRQEQRRERRRDRRQDQRQESRQDQRQEQQRQDDAAKAGSEERSSRRRRRSRGGGSRDNAGAAQTEAVERSAEQKSRPRPGQKSSGLRQAQTQPTNDAAKSAAEGEASPNRRRRRRSRRPSANEGGASDAS